MQTSNDSEDLLIMIYSKENDEIKLLGAFDLIENK
jgi:hypothetical protein